MPATTPERKAHNAYRLKTDRREYDGSTAEIVVNNGSGGIGFGMRLSHEYTGPSASLTPAMARELAADLIARADELDPPRPRGLVRCTSHGNRRHHETVGCVDPRAAE